MPEQQHLCQVVSFKLYSFLDAESGEQAALLVRAYWARLVDVIGSLDISLNPFCYCRQGECGEYDLSGSLSLWMMKGLW